jgi:hypothetical protein
MRLFNDTLFNDTMSILQTYIGSAYASNPIRWIESPQSVRADSIKAEADAAQSLKSDPDAGKPQSASGDVLDLSIDVKKADDKDDAAKDNALKADSQATEKSGNGAKLNSDKELTPEEEQQVEELKARDKEVRTHEAAHVAAGGTYVTSGPSYTFQTGPDGNKYAVGGEVGISTGAVEGDPDATIKKMQTVAAAALAPAEPSGQDRKVAAAARQEIAKARLEKSNQQNEETEEAADEDKSLQSSEDSAKTSGAADAKAEDSGQAASAKSKSVFSVSAAAYKNQSAASYRQPAMQLSSAQFSAFA